MQNSLKSEEDILAMWWIIYAPTRGQKEAYSGRPWFWQLRGAFKASRWSVGFRQMGNLIDLSLQLAASPASTDMIIIRVLRVLFHFKKIPWSNLQSTWDVCLEADSCGRCFYSSLFASFLTMSGVSVSIILIIFSCQVRRDFPYGRFQMVTTEQNT